MAKKLTKKLTKIVKNTTTKSIWKLYAITVSAPIERLLSINFQALQTGVLFEFGQGGALFKLALYLLIYEQHLANFLFLILAS